jgi:hypothetical protein
MSRPPALNVLAAEPTVVNCPGYRRSTLSPALALKFGNQNRICRMLTILIQESNSELLRRRAYGTC